MEEISLSFMKCCRYKKKNKKKNTMAVIAGYFQTVQSTHCSTIAGHCRYPVTMSHISLFLWLCIQILFKPISVLRKEISVAIKNVSIYTHKRLLAMYTLSVSLPQLTELKPSLCKKATKQRKRLNLVLSKYKDNLFRIINTKAIISSCNFW